MEILVKLDKIDQAAAQFLQLAGDVRVFAVSGQMGAGKTTFVSAVCRALGATGSISSPTFSIINEYSSSQGQIFHMDLYRLRSEDEAMQAGVEEPLYSGSYCFVEWPDKAPGLFPDKTCNVDLELIDESTRKLTLTNR